ncbi:MAG: GNAT family N-acetyltransferase [Alphaproteobacteria bacterium]|nr:GNAT family N-acetyltransferase [Alphaproteobacteria bacterium]
MMRFWMAPNGLHVELAEATDAKPLARIHAASFARGWSPAEFSDYIADPGTASVFVACDATRRIAGFALFRRAGDEAELLSLAVERKWRGKGVGGALMYAACEDLRDRAVRHMFLEVEDGNSPALSLYKGLGFVEIGRRAAYYPMPDGQAATALVMRADIG